MFLLVLSCFRILPTGLFLALLDWMCCLWLCSLLLMVSCWLKVALVLDSITQWSKIENFIRKLYGQTILYLYGLQMSTMRVIIFQKINKKKILVTKSSNNCPKMLGIESFCIWKSLKKVLKKHYATTNDLFHLYSR